MTIVSPSLALDAPVADILTRAADLLRVHGLHAMPGEYWHGADKLGWRPGMALDPLAAIAVAMGAHTHYHVTLLLGSSPLAPGEEWPNLHPAVRAVFDHLGLSGRADEQVEAFFHWSDRQWCHQVIATYRACADHHRGLGGAA